MPNRKSHQKKRIAPKSTPVKNYTEYGRCPGSSPKFMNFFYDTDEHRIPICWEYCSAKERDEKFEELRDIPDRPLNILIIRGNPEKVMGVTVTHLE